MVIMTEQARFAEQISTIRRLPSACHVKYNFSVTRRFVLKMNSGLIIPLIPATGGVYT
jgi:hypothetical protein